FLQMIACLGVYVVTLLLVDRWSRFTTVCACLALTGIVHALAGIADYAACLAGLPSLSRPAQILAYLAPPRAQGFMADPNFFMMVLLALLPLAPAWATSFRAGWRRYLWVPAVLFFTALIPMTSSRGGLLAAGLLMVTGIVLTCRRRGSVGSRSFERHWWAASLLGLVLCVGGLALVFAVSPLHVARALQSADFSDLGTLSEGRLVVYARILTSFVHHPLGIGLYNTVVAETGIGGFSHNSLLQIAADMGVPGLIAYGWLFLVTLREIMRFAHGSRYSVWLVALGLGMASVYYSGLTISVYYDEILALMWALVAAGVALAERESSGADPAATPDDGTGDVPSAAG
ncbi:MAG: O-antigen ligase family protein, partial [Armatimonadetes bacterium]|nr:O-antigen ligase family protein [Armatimonadota bacterium]